MGAFGMDGGAQVRMVRTLHCTLAKKPQFDIQNFEFATPAGNDNMNVLQDFDFDSFLHNDGEGVDSFGFDTSFLDAGEMTAE